MHIEKILLVMNISECLHFHDRTSLTEETLKVVHLFFYVADESGSTVNLGREVVGIHGNSLLAAGLHSDFGNWQLHLESEVLHWMFYCFLSKKKNSILLIYTSSQCIFFIYII